MQNKFRTTRELNGSQVIAIILCILYLAIWNLRVVMGDLLMIIEWQLLCIWIIVFWPHFLMETCYGMGWSEAFKEILIDNCQQNSNCVHKKISKRPSISQFSASLHASQIPKNPRILLSSLWIVKIMQEKNSFNSVVKLIKEHVV